MNKMRKRAMEHFPSVLLTLVSIIQALALELLWSKTVESNFLWTLDQQSIVGWGMISVVMLGIVQIWVWYSFMVMGFTWLPSLRDSAFPFVIGLQEFFLIYMIDEQFSGAFLYVLATIFITVNWITHSSFKRARREPDNKLFFGDRPPATIRDFKYTIIIVVLFVLSGLLADTFIEQSWIALLAIVCANLALLFQILNSRRIWLVIMNLSEQEPEDESNESQSESS